MTELVINDNRADHMPVPVQAGQLRANKNGDLVLVIYSEWTENFTGLYLKRDNPKKVFAVTHTPFVEPEIISNYFPYVIKNARITVDLNETRANSKT